MNYRFSILVVSLWFISCGADSDILGAPEDELMLAKAVLIFPEENSICTEGVVLSSSESEVTFRWEEPENTDSYELELQNLFSGITETFESEQNQLPIRILRNTPYSWKVISRSDTTDATSESDTWSFYNAGEGIITHIPFPAENVSPEDNETVPFGQGTLDLSWQASDLDNDIENYDVYFGNTSEPPLIAGAVVSTSFTVTISSGTTYYWKIVTRDSEGNESTSQIFSFSVQ